MPNVDFAQDDSMDAGIVAALYLGLAYALAPWAWRHYEHQRGLADRPMITTTRFGIPGDAVGEPAGRDGEERGLRGAGEGVEGVVGR